MIAWRKALFCSTITTPNMTKQWNIFKEIKPQSKKPENSLLDSHQWCYHMCIQCSRYSYMIRRSKMQPERSAQNCALNRSKTINTDDRNNLEEPTWSPHRRLSIETVFDLLAFVLQSWIYTIISNTHSNHHCKCLRIFTPLSTPLPSLSTVPSICLQNQSIIHSIIHSANS